MMIISRSSKGRTTSHRETQGIADWEICDSVKFIYDYWMKHWCPENYQFKASEIKCIIAEEINDDLIILHIEAQMEDYKNAL